ncbi:MAG: tail fiber protein [Bacteroidota bacterium]
MAQPTLGEIRIFAGNFAPRDWAFCDGQLLAIQNYNALFSLLGTTYGGDGRSTFKLPDLRGRAIMGPGQGPGLTPRAPGMQIGEEAVRLELSNLANHNHGVDTSNVRARMVVSNNPPDTTNPKNSYLTVQPNNFYANAATPGKYLPASDVTYEVEIGFTGDQLTVPFDIIGPSLVLSYIIAIQGIYPTRP